MKNGGKRENAGRKKGGQNKKTLEQKAVQDAFNQRVMTHADNLFNAQLSLAVGSVRIFRVDEEEVDGKVKRIHTLVTDIEEIKDVLDGTGGGAGVVGESYYFVSNILPDNKAIDSMVNRALGKAKESLDVTSGGEKIQTLLVTPKPNDGDA